MKTNRDIVTDAFRAWANGDGYVASIFADDMTWEITGRSAVSRKYADTQQFIDEVLHPATRNPDRANAVRHGH